MDYIAEIQEKLEKEFEGAELCELSCPSGDGEHFKLVVVWDGFEDLTRLQRSRKVHGVIGTYMANGEVHSISSKLKTPNEYSA